MNKEIEFIAGIFGRSQLEMIAVGLLNDDGSPKKEKRKEPHHEDAIKIYDHLSEKVKNIGAAKLNEMAEETNKVAKNLINDDTLINNYLLAMMLYRLYLQEEASGLEKNMMLPKVQRQLQIYEQLDGEEYQKIRRTTHRVADNIWRAWNGKAQLSDELRDVISSKFKRS